MKLSVLALAALLVACSSSPSHPPPLGDCPTGDRCSTTTGGGDHPIPEGGVDAGEAGLVDAADETLLPPIDAATE